MTSCCLQKSEVKNYNEMHCTWVDATSTFFPPLVCFAALCMVAYCKFSRPFSQLFFSALGTGWTTATFPALSTSYFFSAWHYALFTDYKDYKPISDQSIVFQVTENGLQVFFKCQC